MLRDSEFMRINEAKEKPYEAPARLSVIADSAKVTILSFSNQDLDYIYPRIRVKYFYRESKKIETYFVKFSAKV